MSRVVERAIDTHDGREVGVRADLYDLVTVRWVCGDKRSFRKGDELAGVISSLEALADQPDVWLDLRDHNNNRFVAQIVDGELYAGDSPGTDGGSVSWKALKKALRKAL